MYTWLKPFFFRFVQILSAGENKGRKHSLPVTYRRGGLKLEKPVTGTWKVYADHRTPSLLPKRERVKLERTHFVSNSYLFIYICCTFIPMGI